MQNDVTKRLSLESFSEISKDLLGKCNSDAYVFINQPGLQRSDFSRYKKEFMSLQRYIYSASTAINFETIDVPTNETFDGLISFVQNTCNAREIVSVRGNDADSFEAYVDAARRVIRIDYPMLPEDKELRREAIAAHDQFLRTILAQIPSPAQTVIYTGLQPASHSDSGSLNTASIFPEIFGDPSRVQEVEKNDHDLKIPRNFNEHRPKFPKTNAEYISIFDTKFISDNFHLLHLIVTSLVGFLVLQLLFPKRIKMTKRRPMKVRRAKDCSIKKVLNESEQVGEGPSEKS